eukprot:1130880-Prymnesium_polylepis.1
MSRHVSPRATPIKPKESPSPSASPIKPKAKPSPSIKVRQSQADEEGGATETARLAGMEGNDREEPPVAGRRIVDALRRDLAGDGGKRLRAAVVATALVAGLTAWVRHVPGRATQWHGPWNAAGTPFGFRPSPPPTPPSPPPPTPPPMTPPAS